MKGHEADWRWVVLSTLVGLAVWFMPLGLAADVQPVVAITVLVGALWLTEALPLHVTALAIPLLLSTFAGFTPNYVLAPFFDPIVVLLLGGFVLALAMQKHGLDSKIAFFFINRFGSTPGRFLFGLLCATAFLSFWMSNTACAALMIPIALVVLKSNNMLPGRSSYGKAVVLAVAYAATIGGMATIIGSTPNMIAAKFLADQGTPLSFMDWSYYGLPFVLILLPLCWLVLTTLFPAEKKVLRIRPQSSTLDRPQLAVLGVFALTLLLWLTTDIHGISLAMASIVPIILLYALGLLDTKDFSRLEWPTLVMFGGGLALGTALMAVGLDKIVASGIIGLLAGQPAFAVFLGVAVAGVLLTSFASNTAAAALIVPVAIPIAAGLGIELRLLTIVAALGVSLDFITPMGTPPTAIAYSTDYVKVREIALAGIVLAVISVVLLSALAAFVWL